MRTMKYIQSPGSGQPLSQKRLKFDQQPEQEGWVLSVIMALPYHMAVVNLLKMDASFNCLIQKKGKSAANLALIAHWWRGTGLQEALLFIHILLCVHIFSMCQSRWDLDAPVRFSLETSFTIDEWLQVF